MNRRVIRNAFGALILTSGIRAANAFSMGNAKLEVSRTNQALDCPDEPTVIAAVLAQGTVPEAFAESLEISITFDREGDAYMASIRAAGRKQGTRELRVPGASSCKPVSDAATVALAVLLDLVPPSAPSSTEATVQIARNTPLLDPAQTTASMRPPEPPPPPEAKPEKGKPYWISLGADAAIAYGVLGRALTPFFGGEVSFGIGRWEFGVGALHAIARDIDVAPGVVSVGLTAGRANGCVRLFALSNHVALGACGAFYGGVLRGAGSGYHLDLAQYRPWVAAGLGVDLKGSTEGPIGWAVGVDFLAPLHRESFSVQGAGVAYETEAVGLALRGRFTLRIW